MFLDKEEEFLKELKEIEVLESKYLEKFFHFLKFCEAEILEGLQTKDKIEKDWRKHWGSSIFDFSYRG